MPRIPNETLQGAFFLYDNVENAAAGKDPQGSGFLVGREIDARTGYSSLYAVTNWHVACRGASVIRLNKRDGGVEVIDKGPEDWVFRPQGHDIAITPLAGISHEIHDVRYYSIKSFATEEIIAERDIGPGDDVFMVGLLVDAQGIERNNPAVRFGNISMAPRDIRNKLHNDVPTYCISMPSRSGFSGSPVWVYRRVGGNFNGKLDLSDQFLYLLGIHFAQFPEQWKLVGSKLVITQDEAIEIEVDPDGAYVEGMSGVTVVAPGTEIVSMLLNEPALVAWHDRCADAKPVVNYTVPMSELGADNKFT